MPVNDFLKVLGDYISTHREQLIKLDKLKRNVDYMLEVCTFHYTKDFIDVKEKIKECYQECPDEFKDYYEDEIKLYVQCEADAIASLMRNSVNKLFEELKS